MITVLLICLAIIFIVIILSVITITKAYQFKHTVDALPSKEETQQAHKR